MDANAITQIVTALLGGGVVSAIIAFYKARPEKDSITVATSGEVLKMQQQLAQDLRKELEDNRKECREEIEAVRAQCQLELKASEEECRLLLGYRDAEIKALQRSVEELRRNQSKN